MPVKFSEISGARTSSLENIPNLCYDEQYDHDGEVKKWLKHSHGNTMCTVPAHEKKPIIHCSMPRQPVPGYRIRCCTFTAVWRASARTVKKIMKTENMQSRQDNALRK